VARIGYYKERSDYMKKDAFIDQTGMYRYSLSRIWNDDAPSVLFIMLNPSTADANEDDRTIRRCIGFAKAWGFGSLEIRNLFAFRSTNPNELKKCKDPIGPENDRHILEAAQKADKIVLAWGAHGVLKERNREVYKMIASYIPECIDKTNGGHPKHPLYIAADRRPFVYSL
jgi:hypothetical protein